MAEQIRILTWNVRSFNTFQEQLWEEIKRQRPHVVVLQETMTWVVNDRDFGWVGAKVLNMEAIKQTKVRRGGLAMIINPEVEFTELHRYAIGPEFNENNVELPSAAHVELSTLFNTENTLPNGDFGRVPLQELSTATPTADNQMETQLTDPNKFIAKPPTKQRNRAKRKPDQLNQTPSYRRTANPVGGPNPTKGQDFIQAISIKVKDGPIVTGVYIGPQTKQATTENFLAEVMDRNGEHQVIIGDLNARHHNWDKTTNDRGLAVMAIKNRYTRTYVVAAREPSYHKTVRKKKKKGTKVTYESNPDIALVRTHDATAYTEAKDWAGVSDHRPVLLTVKEKLTLKVIRHRIAKSLFFSDQASKEAVAHYNDGIEDVMKSLDTANGTGELELQEVYRKVEQFITRPWERIVERRPPRKPLWWNRSIGSAQQKRRYIARKWHKVKKEADRWRDRDICEHSDELHEQLVAQQTTVRRLSRQARAKLLAQTKQKLKEAGLTDQSRAIKKDQRGKALRVAEAQKRGKQLSPAEFTAYMGAQQGGDEPIQAREFKVDNRKFRRRVRRAINRMERNKAVGVDNVHSEMLQVAPTLFARLLTKLWETVGRTKIVPSAWTQGVMVPLLKQGANDKPENYRPLCMLSHIRKALERAVVDELDELVRPDRMQFGFQSAINTLQAAIDVAAVLHEAVHHLFAILDLTKAYDRVVRAKLIEKLESMDLPKDLVNQIVVFLVPLIVHTVGDVTAMTAKLTIGLVQGGSASPALFRIFIDDLAGDLRQTQGKSREGVGDSLKDPAKLVADDVVVMARNEKELQDLLDTCTKWARRNHLEWKPQKCSVVVKRTGALRRCTFWLDEQPVLLSRNSKYLGLKFGDEGFMKDTDSSVKKKSLAACHAITNQPFFDAGLPTKTLLTLYRTNVRSILMYGLVLTKDLTEMERLDKTLLNLYLKKICFLGRPLPAKLIDRLCLRLRLPSLKMEVENAARKWGIKLRRAARQAPNRKSKTHAEDSLRAIRQLHPDTILRKHAWVKSMNESRWLLEKFKEWHVQLAPSKKSSRTIDKITHEKLHNDILDSHELLPEHKRSALRYCVYRFPLYTELSTPEEQALQLLLKQHLNHSERDKAVRVLKRVHARDEQTRVELEAAKSLLDLHTEGHTR